MGKYYTSNPPDSGNFDSLLYILMGIVLFTSIIIAYARGLNNGRWQGRCAATLCPDARPSEWDGKLSCYCNVFSPKPKLKEE